MGPVLGPDRRAPRLGGRDKAIERLIAEVAEYSTSEIESFDDRLHEAVHALDGPAWFDQPVNGPRV